ncbi:MAG: hypothetical protein ABJG14_17640, partial [Sulfitobacter sp.]
NRRRHLRHYPNGPGDNRRPVTAAKPRPKNKVTPFLGTLSQFVELATRAVKGCRSLRWLRRLSDQLQAALDAPMLM